MPSNPASLPHPGRRLGFPRSWPTSGGTFVDNQHKLIPGYRDLSTGEIERIKVLKAMATHVGTTLKGLPAAAPTDGGGAAVRYVALARTHLEIGFMFATKSVARPTDDLGAFE